MRSAYIGLVLISVLNEPWQHGAALITVQQRRSLKDEASPDVDHGHPRLDPAPDVGADLPMSLGRLPEITPHLLIGSVQRPLLLAAGSPGRAAPGGGGGGTLLYH